MSPNMKNLFSSKGKKVFMSILSFAVLCAIFGYVAFETTKKPITLVVDGKVKHVETHAGTVAQLLNRNGIYPKKHDLVKPGLDSDITNKMKIVWDPAKSIQVAVNGKDQTVWTTANTVGEYFSDKNINLKAHDVVEPALDTPIKENLAISYKPAFEIDLNDGGKTQKTWANSTTVADFLKQHDDIKLTKYDKVIPAKDQLITENTDVKIIRVKKVTDVVEEPIDYKTVKRNDSDIDKGETKVLASGKEGQVAKHYEVTFENGKEVSRKLVKTETIQESQDRIVAYGTKTHTSTRQSSRSISNNSGKTFYVSSTAYTANCTGCSGYTSYNHINLNTHPNSKVIAVDPDVIPLGSTVYVEGYGYAVAADTGGAINGNHIDVFFSSNSRALGWGRRTVKIKILN